MNLVGQAVFTSAETDRTAGYQLVATSADVSDDDARTLSAWGPSHGSLLNSGRQASSINFHPLPSGSYCVSRTTVAGNEYSGRGTRVYTQCLIVSPHTLSQFSNNPFSLIRVASASGLLKQYENVPDSLEPVSLVGRAPAVDPSLLSRVRREFGPEPIARLVQAALTCTSMLIAGTSSGEHAVAALLNCLPPQIRPEFSFSTGLRTSARRPFRLLSLANDREEQRRACRVADLSLVDLSDNQASQFNPADGWARAIHRIFETGRISLLTRCFGNSSSEISIDQLNALGFALLEELESSDTPRRTSASPAQSLTPSHSEPGHREAAVADDSLETTPPSSPENTRQEAHAAHPRFLGCSSQTPTAAAPAPGPSNDLAADHPAIVTDLEALDDLVYDAIKGDDAALDELRRAWPRFKADLGDELLDQSREQYLRYALQVWEQRVDVNGVRPTERAVNSLEVLCLLFDED